MSTLGGSRGERNAKPKFSALDINRMYKNSRGETSETTTQKNQVPRKHGMQSLGKVPSARRPPANLPSLKAETVTTTTPSPTVANNNQIIQPEDGGIQGTNNLKNTNINSNSSLNKNTVSNCANNTLNQNSNQIHNHGNNSNSNSSAVIGGIGSKLINNSITSTSAVGKANIGVVGPNINQTHYNQQNKPVTWSAITTGNDHGGGQRGGGKSSNNAPPLYQSPQFQYEFPTLDGTVGGGANGGYHQSVNRKNGNADHRDHINHQQQQQNLQNQLSTHQQSQSYYQRDIERQGRPQQQHLRHDAHNYKDGSDECGGGGTQLIEEDSRDITEVSLRPQTDAAAWLQQQEKAIKNAATGNDHLMNHQGLVPQNQQQSNASSGALNAAVPLPILALMPPFMQRGVPLPNASNSSGIGLISTSSNYQNGVSKDSTVTSNSMRSQSIRSNVQSSYRSNSPVISGNIRGSNKRFNNSVPSNGMQDAEFSGSLPHTIRKEKEFIIEPEVAQMQRPIIREEDLERLNAIANDDSWTKQDDIDYSKKLTFSDEEESPDEQSPTSEPEKSPSNKNANTIDQRKNSSTSVSSSNGPTSTWQRKDRDTGNEREKSGNNLESVEDLHHRASVPPGAIALDAGVYERVKLRKEEEERRDMERKQAAARKKQELEMKMNSKKAAGDGIDNNSVSVSENQTNNRRSGNRVYDRSLTADRGNRPFDTRDMRTAGGDHIRNMNNIGNGNSNANNSSVATVAGGTNKSVFSTHFQSNLPPRFLRQQQMQSQGSTTMSSGGGSSNSIISRNISVSATGNSGLERSSSTTSTFDNSRYIHKSTQRLGGGTSGGVRNDYRDNYTRNYGRSRNDSDREESYGHVNRTTTGGASGREDHSQHVNSLPRSISDTSQRKISVSSNDESVKQNNTFDSSNKDNTNTNMVSSWAEETNVEMKRQRDESFSSSHSHESIPIKILQRPHTQKSVSEEDNMPAQQQHTKQTQLHQAQNSSRRISESSDNQSVTFAPTQILKRSELNDGKAKSVTSNEESPTTDDVFRTLETQESVEEAKSERPCSNNSVVNEAQSKSNEDECKPQNAAANERKESQATSNSNASFPDTEATIAMPKLEEKARNNSNNGSSHPPKEQKRNNSRGGGSNSGPRERNERNSHSRSYGSGNSYRGNRGGSWKYGGGRYMDSHYVGDSSYGDENECNADHRRSERNPKVQRREMVGGSRRGTNNASLDDRVFTPRGEPSRRGRGAGGNMGDRVSSSSYRRSSNSNTGGGGSRNYGRSNYSGDHKDMQKRISESSDNVNSGIDKAKQSQCTLNSGIAKALEKEQDTTNSTQKQNQSVPPPKAIEQENRSSTIATTSPIFGSNGGGNNQERKENASSVEDDRKCITAGCVDRKTLPKEKDTLGSETPSTTPITTRSNNTMNSCSPSNSQTKNTDMPITTLPLFNQGIAKPMNQQQKSQQQIQLPQTQQSHIITKPPPGLAPTMLKPNNSSSVANIPSTCASGGLQKSTTDMQRSKSDTNNIANLTTAGDKSNKLGSVGDAKGSNSGSVVGGNLILDGAPVNTIIFENTNYKQQAQQAAQIKRSSESIVASSSTVSCGANASAAGSVDTLSTAFSQVSFSNSSSSSNKSTDVTSVQNCGGTRVSPNDYDKDMKLGFTFGDASDSYGSGGTHNIGLISDVENKVSTGNTSVSVTQAQQGVISQHQQQQQQQQQQQNIISTADLNMKIASVKKVWETVAPSVTDSSNNSTLQQQHLHQQQQQQAHQQQQMDTVVDPTGHMSAASFVAAAVAASQQQQQQQHMPHYVTAVHMAQHHVLSSPGPASSAYGSHGCSPFDTTQLEQQFAQTASGIVVGGGNVGEDSTIVGYTSPQQSQANMAQQQQQALKQHSSDVVVKQHQQSSASCKQMSGSHHNSSMGMSPPPNLQQQQQQQQQQASVSQQQIHAPQPFYQASPQFSGIPTIPSPPAMVFNSSQMAPPPSQGGLYAPFHSLDHSSRSQFSAAAAAAAAHNFPGHYGAATAAPGGPFNAYPMQTPPNMPTAPTPDMYSNLTSQFRMGGGPSPFGNPSSQQLNNPNAAAVAIISSNSNSLMSTVGSVKPPPSSQQLGTIGSKSAGGSGPYATTTQGYMNLYAAPGPPQHPQAPPGPPPGAHQLQSNSFYSNSAAGPSGPAAFYGGPPPQGGAGAQNYGLAAAAAAAAANLYGSHGGHQGAPPGTGGSSGPPQGPPGAQSQHSMGNFNTQFMNSQLLATAAAMNPFRGSHTPQQQAVAAAYMKSSQQQQNHLQDSMGRQLKSPLGADVSLNLVKQTQSQPSPPHHKNYGNWDLQNQVIQQQAVQQQQTQQTQLNQRSSVGGNNSNINASSRGGPPGMPTAQNAQGRYPAPIQRPTNYPQHPQQQQVQQQIQRSGGVSSNVRQNNSSAAGSASSTNSGQQCPGGNHNSNVGGGSAVSNNGGSGGGGSNTSGSNNVVNPVTSGNQSNQMNKTYFVNNSNNGAGSNRGGNHT